MPDVTAVLQASVAMLPFTATSKLQLCPPIVMGNVAVPLVVAVPLMVPLKVPSPLVKRSLVMVAVNPVTPVDAIVLVSKLPLIPPL